MNSTTPSPRIARVIDLRRRIHRVVDYIDEHLDAELSLNRLADIACISPFHFHRIYTRAVGQSPADTVRWLRLTRATNEIRIKGMSVTQAALTAGYGSPQAFARACRREFGHSPTEMTAMGPTGPGTGPDLSGFTVVARAPVEMDALMYDGPREQADVLAIDAQAYSHLLGNHESMSVYFEDPMTPADRPIRCALCFCVEERRDRLPARLQLQRLQIPGGTYACLEQRGLLFDLAPHWQRFLRHTLPRSGWIARPGPVLRLLVSDRAITPPSQRLSYLYVPIERLPSH